MKILVFIVVAIKVNEKAYITNWYVVLKHTQRAVEKLGLSPCHTDIAKKLNIFI